MCASLVSIIVPVYNTAEYVEECIQSILSQSYEDIELILVNDGSTDGSGEICNRYGHLPNVRYLAQENLGVTAARRRGVDAANGEWIMFVDSDDLITKNTLESFLSKSDDVDIVVGGISPNVVAYPDIIDRDEYVRRMYEKTVSSSPCAKLFRKSLFNEKTLCFPNTICRWEDWLMNLQIAVDNRFPVKTVSERVYLYTQRPNSSSHTYILSFDELETLCGIADGIIQGDLSYSTAYNRAKLENRLRLFTHELVLNGFHNEPRHPFVLGIKQCLDEAGVWRPLARLMLSASSPWAVKAVWNMRKVAMRIQHPSMIARDLKRISTKYLKV